MPTDHYPAWVCIDCTCAVVNWDDHPRPDDAAGFLADEFAGLVTYGLMADEHSTYCDVFPVLNADDEDADELIRGEYDGSAECSCEVDDFSRRSCDGCGSHLAGYRHAFTYHIDEVAYGHDCEE